MMVRIWKRVLSLALVAVLTVGLLAGSAVAAFTDADKITHAQAVDDLVELNVLSGKPDGSFDPSAPVTRAEMCKIVSVLLNGGKVPELESRSWYNFTDVSTHWAGLLIEYCAALEIVSGRGDGTFDPDGSVTARECSKMLLAAAGYESGKEGFDGAGWAGAVDDLAKELGLYLDLDSSRAGETLSRDEAAQMVRNVLSLEVVTYMKEVDGKLKTVDRYGLGMDFLERHFGMEYQNGKLVTIPRPESSYEPIVLPPHD